MAKPQKNDVQPATRRLNHEGTLEQLPSGKWSCYTRKDKKKIRGKPAATQSEAAKNLQDKLRSLEPESANDARSFGTLAELWLLSKNHYEPTTKDVYSYWIGTLSADPLGQMPFKRITERHLRAWRDRQSWAPATLRNRCLWLNQVLAWGGSQVRVPIPPKQDHDRRPLTPVERATVQMRLLRVADPIDRVGALLCWHCGMRRSEACGLMHEDRDGNGVWIRRAAVIAKGQIIVRPKRGNRKKKGGWIPLPPALIDIIGTGKGFVLGSEKEPLNPRSLTYRFDRLISESGLREAVPFMGLHALRRTCGMMLLESGADVVTAATIMRHDPKMLLNEYAKSRQDLMTSATANAFGTREKSPSVVQLPQEVPQKAAS